MLAQIYGAVGHRSLFILGIVFSHWCALTVSHASASFSSVVALDICCAGECSASSHGPCSSRLNSLRLLGRPAATATATAARLSSTVVVAVTRRGAAIMTAMTTMVIVILTLALAVCRGCCSVRVPWSLSRFCSRYSGVMPAGIIVSHPTTQTLFITSE